MASVVHEVMIEWLRDQPQLLSQLLQALGFAPLEPGVEVVDSAVRLVNPVEVHPDLVLTQNQDSWTFVEVQLMVDHEKPRRWAVAIAAMLDSRGVMGDLIVLTSRAAVARWAENLYFERSEGDGAVNAGQHE